MTDGPPGATGDGTLAPGDAAHLARAIELAATARRGTAPNPRVGAVITTSGGELLGEGWHRRAGDAHAETIALAAAGTRARGGTLYSSLEPCAHSGRTPPCTRAIRDAGVVRVVIAMEDPDPRVAGRGIAELRETGIIVDVAGGDIAQRAAEVNEDYVVHRRHGRAFAALKVAATLDGRIADREGRSRWITGPAARERGRALRHEYGALVVGSGTVLADDPLLLPPPGDVGHPPFVRAVLDTRLRVEPSARLFTDPANRDAGSPVVIYTGASADPERVRALEDAGAVVVRLGEERVAPADVLRDLGARGVLGALVEGGGRTHGAFLESGAADKLFWFSAPSVFADPDACAAAVLGPRLLDDRFRWRIHVALRLEEDILLVLYPG